MPRSIDKPIAKDLLEKLDPDIQAVRFNHCNGDLILDLDRETDYLFLNEQDLLILLEFLRKEKEQ
jgi:hypothetical protein